MKWWALASAVFNISVMLPKQVTNLKSSKKYKLLFLNNGNRTYGDQ